jgi:lysophospholipase L1-like esterase
LRLASQARQSGIPLEDPRIIARTGWTTGELSSGIDAARPQGPYGLVSLLIGVNNQYRGLSLEEYRGEFASLLERAIGFAGGEPDRVLVLSIPDWGASFYGLNYDPEVIAREIDAFNAANRTVALARGTRYVDVTPQSRAAAGDEAQFAADGLHPSGLMYAAWAGLAVKALAVPGRARGSGILPGAPGRI